MKLTQEHYLLFRDECENNLKRLGLKGWKVFYQFKPLEDCFGQADWDYSGMVAAAMMIKDEKKSISIPIILLVTSFFVGLVLISGCKITECAAGHYESVYHPARLDMTYIGDKGFGPVWQPGYTEDEWVCDEKQM